MRRLVVIFKPTRKLPSKRVLTRLAKASVAKNHFPTHIRDFAVSAVLALVLVPMVGVGAANAAVKGEIALSQVTVELAPLPQTLTVADHAVPPAVMRDAYTVTQYSYTSPVACSYRISSDIGTRTASVKGASTSHNGSDIICTDRESHGTSIIAISNGTVIEATDNGSGYGTKLVIAHHAPNGEYFTAVYAHLVRGSISVAVGQSVVIGQQVAQLGNTGISSGAHLHLELGVGGSWRSTSAASFFKARAADVLPGGF